jgi:hypothetical protein
MRLYTFFFSKVIKQLEKMTIYFSTLNPKGKIKRLKNKPPSKRNEERQAIIPRVNQV